MKRFALLLALVVLAPTLSGFKLLENPHRRWVDLPIRYNVGDVPPFGMTNEEAQSLLVDAYDNWGEVDCSPLTAELNAVVPNQPTFNSPNQTLISHEGNLASGVNAAAVTHAGAQAVPYNGIGFRNITAMNIIFNSGIRWGTPDDVDAPGCFNVNSYLATGTHEIGHGLGFGHSCDDGEACPNAAQRLATMYWSGARCDGSRETLNEDDAAAVQAAYGVAVDFELTAVDGELTLGSVPLDVRVDVPQDYIDQEASDGSLRFNEFEINFGDGSDHLFFDNDGSAISAEHTYEREGQFTITVKGRGFDDDCGGDFIAERRRVGEVLACGAPEAAFEYRDIGDNTLELVNTTPIGAFGCITEFRWILDGQEEAGIATYEPTWTFDEPGSHTVKLIAAGPAGESSDEQTVEVTEAGEGCSSSVGGQGGWLLALLPLAVVRKRR